MRKSRKGYQLYCRKGILDKTYSNEELTSWDDDRSITFDAWRQASKVSFKSVINDSSCIELCTCVLMDVDSNLMAQTVVSSP